MKWKVFVEQTTKRRAQEYHGDNPNQTFSLECEDPSGCTVSSALPYLANQQAVLHKLANILLYPTLDSLHYQQERISTGSSTIDNIRIYKHHPAVDPPNMSADRHFDFAILTSSKTANLSRTSKIYFGTSNLVFYMGRAHTSLTLFNMWRPKYSSSLEKSSEEDLLRQMDPEGRPDVLGWHTVPDLHLSSVEFEGGLVIDIVLPYIDDLGLINILVGFTVADFMKVLTGWQNLFTANASNITLSTGQRLSWSRYIEGARVMVWERETETGKDLQLLVQESSTIAEPNNVGWLSASRE